MQSKVNCQIPELKNSKVIEIEIKAQFQFENSPIIIPNSASIDIVPYFSNLAKSPF